MRGDFKEFFTTKDLNEQRLGSIEFVLNSPAYMDDFKPFMESVVNTLDALWKDRSQARKDQYPDEFLAGGVVFGQGLLKFFDHIIHETKMERIHGAMEGMTPDMQYDVRRERGEAKPIVGFDQQAEPQPLRPEDDF